MSDHDEMTTREREEREQVEQRLRSALEARARGSVPDRRLPPPIDWPQERSGRRTWLTPLAIAASVLVIAGGVAVATTQRTKQAPPATQTSSVTVGPTPSTSSTAPSLSSPSSSSAPTAPSSSSAPTAPTAPSTGSAPQGSSPATSGPATGAPSTTAPQGGTPATVGGATLVVPTGWSIRPDTGSGGSTPINDTWCVEPGGGATCPITFVRLDPTNNPLDTDAQGGLESNPQYCGPGSAGYAVHQLVTYNDLTISGRAAEYRQWRFVCTSGTTIDVAQYTVVTPRAYLLFSDKASPQVRDVMAGIAASATLPAATSPTRLYDHGIVRTVVAVPGGGWEISLDRVIIGWPNQSATTYTYRVPVGVEFGNGTPPEALGKTVAIHTDGQVVTSADVDR